MQNRERVKRKKKSKDTNCRTGTVSVVLIGVRSYCKFGAGVGCA